MSITNPATSGVRHDVGARRERFYRLNWIAFVSLLSLPFSFFTRAGAATLPILRRAASATAG
jgi:hypothetical protein